MSIPAPHNTVNVRIIDPTARIIVPNEFADKTVQGNQFLDCPAFSFLVEHPSGRRLLFDLSVRTDYDKLPPVIQHYFQQTNPQLTDEKDVHTILQENGVDPKSIETIIWSHWHYDHTGDPSKFDPSTALIVRPSFKQMHLLMPGYPENEGSPMLESDYEGREVRQIDFEGENTVKIGGFDAFDYFGDGSFYILTGPGHTIAHICALAATTTSPASYIVLGGDACHRSAEMRPSKFFPLPLSIDPHPLDAAHSAPCPGAMFEHLLRGSNKTIPFYAQKRPGMIASDPDAADETIEKLQEAEGTADVFVVVAHDNHINGVVPMFPESANDFLAQEWHNKTRWTFLPDFKPALKKDSNL